VRHRKKGKKLGRKPAHRQALWRSLTARLIEHEQIITTLPKAKGVRPFAEKIISLGRMKTLHNYRRALALLGDEDAVHRLFEEVGPRYADRPGGYTRVIRLGERRLGDSGEKAMIELVEEEMPERAERPEVVPDAEEPPEDQR
jgi:large subunit ribosomal protein L17